MSQVPPQDGGAPRDGDTLEHYLDRRLRGPQKEAFEQQLRADAAARAQARIQQELNASLARIFGPAAEEAAPISIPFPAQPAPAAGPNPWRRRFPIIAAAAVLLIAAGVYMTLFRSPPAPAVPDRLGPLYQAQLAAGFVPQTVCTTRQEFAKWVQDYYGQPLYPDTSGQDLQLVGWNYGPAVSSNSGVLLARVNGREVIVVVDRSVREKGTLPPPADPSLRSFRQQMGGVVLYEVSPLDRAEILPRLSLKDAPGGG